MTISDPDVRRDGRTTDTRARVLATALDAFVEQGFSSTSLQDIADRLGLTKAALYYHFASKEQLVKAVMQPLIDDMTAFREVAERPSITPRGLLDAYVRVILTHRRRCLALGRDPSGIAVVHDDDWVEFWIAPVQRRLLVPGAGVEARLRAIAAVSALGRSFLLADVGDDELAVAAVRVALEAFGIGPRAADRPIPASGLVGAPR